MPVTGLPISGGLVTDIRLSFPYLQCLSNNLCIDPAMSAMFTVINFEIFSKSWETGSSPFCESSNCRRWIPVVLLVVEMNSTSNHHLLSDMPYSSISQLTQSTSTLTMVV